MGEGKRHKELKKIAIKHLQGLGFSKNEIKTEVVFPITGRRKGEANRTYFIVDVAAKNDTDAIVIECGNVDREIRVWHNHSISVLDRISTIKARGFKFFNLFYIGKTKETKLIEDYGSSDLIPKIETTKVELIIGTDESDFQIGLKKEIKKIQDKGLKIKDIQYSITAKNEQLVYSALIIYNGGQKMNVENQTLNGNAMARWGKEAKKRNKKEVKK